MVLVVDGDIWDRFRIVLSGWGSGGVGMVGRVGSRDIDEFGTVGGSGPESIVARDGGHEGVIGGKALPEGGEGFWSEIEHPFEEGEVGGTCRSGRPLQGRGPHEMGCSGGRALLRGRRDRCDSMCCCR